MNAEGQWHRVCVVGGDRGCSGRSPSSVLLLSLPPSRSFHLKAIFRGFLLASLARYMPVWAAVVASSLLFAMCHFRLQASPCGEGV